MENPKFREVYESYSFLSEANMFWSRLTLADLDERDLRFPRFKDSEEFELYSLLYIFETSEIRESLSRSFVGPKIREFINTLL